MRANPYESDAGQIDRRCGVASKSAIGAAVAALAGIHVGNVGTEGAAKRGARPARVLSRLATLLAAFAVFAQLAALPYHHRPSTRNDLAAVAAELKATFGPTAVLCKQSDDPSSLAPKRRQSNSDAGCPLCQFPSQAVLLEAPPPALPEQLAIAEGAPPARPDFPRPRARAIRFAQPRAPPSFA